MKKLSLLLFAFFFCFGYVYSEEETVKPSIGVEIEKRLEYLFIDDELYKDVTISLESVEGLLCDFVKLKVIDSKGKKIFSKRFNNMYLYIYPKSRSIAVGASNYTKCFFCEHKGTLKWRGQITVKDIL